jgi:hypothetical protein
VASGWTFLIVISTNPDGTAMILLQMQINFVFWRVKSMEWLDGPSNLLGLFP